MEGAEAEHRAVLEVRSHRPVPEHPGTLAGRGNIAVVLRDMGLRGLGGPAAGVGRLRTILPSARGARPPAVTKRGRSALAAHAPSRSVRAVG